jgi:hypothetical protein
MNTDKRFLNYKKYDNFQQDLTNGNIPEDAIVFIQDKGCIWARGKEYLGIGTKELTTAINELIASLSAVAKSGEYNDLKDKPTIPTIPTNVSAFTNDKGYLTQHQSLEDYAKKSDLAGIQPGSDYLNAKQINAKLQTLQEFLANQYVLKKDVQHPETEEWSKASIYEFGELPEADIDDSHNINIVAIDENAFDVTDIQNDVCYFIYK